MGAIYNGQYAKGLVHAIIFGLLVSIVSSGSAHGMEPLFGILIAAWVFYMAMEAYHTAHKRRAGEAVDEFSSLIDLHTRGSRFPAGAVVLIGLGVLLLLNTTDIIPLERVLRYWPVLLILLGVYMLYVRLTGLSEQSGGTAPGVFPRRCNMINSNELVRAVRGPIILITIGTLFALDHFTPWGFQQTWPVILIVIGLLTLVSRATRSGPTAGGVA